VPFSGASLLAARLDRDAAVVGGAQQTLVAGGEPGLGLPAIGPSQSMLAWRQGWNDIRGTPFGTTFLGTFGTLPATSVPLSVANPTQAGPPRTMVAALDVGGALAVGWLDNEQSFATPSDRVTFTFVYPRYVAP
jgi:hypothetical protein